MTSVEKTGTDGLVDTYTITFSDGTTSTFTVTNGESNVIESIELTGSSELVDTYTITYSDGSTKTYTVTNGKGINRIDKTSTDVLTDTYTIYWNDNTTTTYLVVNGETIEVVLYISQLEDHAHISLLSSDGKSGRTVLEGDHVRVSDSEISWNVTNDELFGGEYSTIILERQR